MEALSALIIDGDDSINSFISEASASYSVRYNAENNAYNEQRGVAWTVAGPAAVTADGDSCTVTLTSEAKADDVITLTATSTYDSSIIGTKTITCVYLEQTIAINLNSGQWVDSGNLVDGHTLFQSAKSYHVSNGKDVCTLSFIGFSTTTVKCRSNGENNYDYLEVGPIDGTVSRAGSSNLLTLKGKASSSAYTDCVLTFPDTGTHTVQIMYSKDGSADNNEDRGFFYIDSAITPTVTA